MKQEILKILKILHPDIDFTDEKHFIDKGLLDSLDVFTLVSELSEIYNIHINVKYITAENFNSIETIQNLIEKLKKKE